MKIVISTLFLVFLVFLGSIQLSSQSGSGGSSGSGSSNRAPLPYGGKRMGQTTTYPNLRPGTEIPLPNGKFYRSNGEGDILIFYASPNRNTRVKQGRTLIVISPSGQVLQPGQPGYEN